MHMEEVMEEGWVLVSSRVACISCVVVVARAHPANMAPMLLQNHSGALNPMIHTPWNGSRPTWGGVCVCMHITGVSKGAGLPSVAHRCLICIYCVQLSVSCTIIKMASIFLCWPSTMVHRI